MGNNLSPLYQTIATSTPPPRRNLRDTIKNIEVAEVIDIILDENHPKAEKNPANIGKAQIRRALSDKGKKDDELGWANPLYPNGQIYPLIHEQVLILWGPSSRSGKNYGASRPYYIGPVNVWGLENYNPVPGTGINMANQADGSSNAAKYTSFTGNPNPSDTTSQDLKFGKTFVAKPGVQKLRPFEGDRLFEGRWGQSIRFTSNIQEHKDPQSWKDTEWSLRGEDGDPIIIIRNGEPDDADWTKSLVEDINKDPSSIYITSTQLINLDWASWNFKSYGLATDPDAPPGWVSKYIPDMPNQYGGKDKSQILIKSDRVIIQAGEGRDSEVGDSIFLNAKKSISLSSSGSIMLDSAEPTIINSPEIRMGIGAREPAVLGDTLVSILNELLTSLQAADIATPVGPGLHGPGAQVSFAGLLARTNTLLCKKAKVE